MRLETKEMELEEKSRKSEAQEKRFRQKFLKVAAVSLNSKLRRVMISRTFMHWRRVTWSECARETENAARAALSDGINLMESSRAQLQNAQNEADRLVSRLSFYFFEHFAISFLIFVLVVLAENLKQSAPN